MKKLFLTAIIAGLTVSSLAINANAKTKYSEMLAGTYELDETHASLIWRVSHLGLSQYTARFTDFDAEIIFDPKQPELSKVTAEINPTSIKTDYPYPEKKDFDKKLIEGGEWFNSKEFPEIKFVSTDIKRNGDDTGVMTGNLTFLGVTKPVTLDVKFNGAMAKQPFSKKPALGFSATGSLKRSQWGMGTYVPNIGDEVEIIIEAEFSKMK
ncbi:MAG: YceI family protein [Pseudomonadota bacterium]